MEPGRGYSRQSDCDYAKSRKGYRQRCDHSTNVPRMAEVCCAVACGCDECERKFEFANRRSGNCTYRLETSDREGPTDGARRECGAGAVSRSAFDVGQSSSSPSKRRRCRGRWRAAYELASIAGAKNQLRRPRRSCCAPKYANTSRGCCDQYLGIRGD